MTDNPTPTQAPPRPHPRLREFERLIGSWDMEGRTLGSDVDDVRARATFEYLPGGFFVAQRFEADFDGMPIESLEIIGYDPESDTFPSTVYASMAATPLSYRWELDGADVRSRPTSSVRGSAAAGTARGSPEGGGRCPDARGLATSPTTSRVNARRPRDPRSIEGA